MSKVCHAYDNKLGRTVCLKLLDKAKTAKFEERFAIQGLDKPSRRRDLHGATPPQHRAHLRARHDQPGEPYLVMEWIEGSGLNFLIETRNDAAARATASTT